MERDAEAGTQDAAEALEETDRRLRRMVRRIAEGHAPGSEELERELRGARRQLRFNRQLLGWNPPPPGRNGDSGNA